MTTIIATVRTTNPALKAELREPTTKEFKRSGRGLIAAVKWADDWVKTLKSAQGNLCHPRVTLTIDGVPQDYDRLSMHLRPEMTVKNAETILGANYAR